MRVVIAEDTVLLREGLAGLLEDAGHEVVGRAGDAETLLALVGEHAPDLAVVDVRMPPSYDDEGTRAASEIRRSHPGTAALVLSQHIETRHIVELVTDGGGFGYLLKDRVLDVDDFLDAARRVSEGGSALDPQVVAPLIAAPSAGRARRAHPARARGPLADGRGPHERRDRAAPVAHREDGRDPCAHDPHEARPSGGRGRQPPRARRARLPAGPGLALRRGSGVVLMCGPAAAHSVVCMTTRTLIRTLAIALVGLARHRPGGLRRQAQDGAHPRLLQAGLVRLHERRRHGDPGAARRPAAAGDVFEIDSLDSSATTSSTRRRRP